MVKFTEPEDIWFKSIMLWDVQFAYKDKTYSLKKAPNADMGLALYRKTAKDDVLEGKVLTKTRIYDILKDKDGDKLWYRANGSCGVSFKDIDRSEFLMALTREGLVASKFSATVRKEKTEQQKKAENLNAFRLKASEILEK